MKLLLILSTLFFIVNSNAQTARELYNEGLQLKSEKKSKEAIVKFKAALAKDPILYNARYELGWCYNDTKNYVNALASFIMVRKDMQQYPKWNFETGYAYHKYGKLDSARKYLQKTIELKQDYKLAYKQLFLVESEARNYEKAIEYSKNYEALITDIINDWVYFYEKGFSYNALKQYDNAIINLSKSVDINSKNINTFLELGFAYTKLKNANEAINFFEKAKAIDSNSHIAYNGIGEVYRDINKDYNKAISWYQKALAKKKEERKACFGIGYCLNAQGKYDDAIPFLTTAIKQEPTYAAAFTELGFSYSKLNKFSNAIESFNKAISLNENTNAYYYLVEVYIKQKDKTNALATLEMLKKKNTELASKLQTKVNAL